MVIRVRIVGWRGILHEKCYEEISFGDKSIIYLDMEDDCIGIM